MVWQNLNGCGDSLALAEAVRQDKRLYLIVTEDTHTALRLEHEISFPCRKRTGAHFPDWKLPYDVFSPLPEIVSGD